VERLGSDPNGLFVDIWQPHETRQDGEMDQQAQFIKLFVAAERKFLGYLVTLLPSIEDAEELMQETSIVIWEKFEEFLATQKGEPDVDRFVAWGCKIALYKALNYRRQRRSGHKLLGDDIVQLISTAWLERQESDELAARRSALARCLDQLPSSRRELLHEYYWQKHKVEDMALKQDRTAASIYKLLQRVRISLHKCIDQHLAG
jgi:RNA polymerase sigma-70 factor (ECF subfamily)